MGITVLLDHDLEGNGLFIEVGLKETRWDEVLRIEFKRLRDYGLPDNCPDQTIWRFVQERGLFLITNNRNDDGETSLQATIRRENTLDKLPVLTVSDKDSLEQAEYRQRVAERLAAILIDLDNYLGTGRLFLP